MTSNSAFRLFAITLTLFFFLSDAEAQISPTPATKNMFQNNALIEVFSSEGCNSCPLADAFMSEVIHISDSSQTPVYVIDFHVDIWNKAGWIDPFSDSNNTNRQKTYASKREMASVYTPMAFVNGIKALIASDKKAVGKAISGELTQPSTNYVKLGVSAEPNEDSLIIAYKLWGNLDSLIVNIALVQREAKSFVTAGENIDKLLIHHNVCRQFYTEPAKTAEGKKKIYVSPAVNLDDYRMIVYVQHARTWKVVASDQMSFKP